VPADALPVTAGGTSSTVSFSCRMGYRHTAASGVAVNGQAEGMYMVTSGTHFNSACCFDYGNVEVPSLTRATAKWIHLLGTPVLVLAVQRSWPVVMPDLENGLFQSNTGGSQITSNTGNRRRS